MTEITATAEMQAALLSRALPYMQRYEHKTVVVKYGGHAMGDLELGKAFARDSRAACISAVAVISVIGMVPWLLILCMSVSQNRWALLGDMHLAYACRYPKNR